MSKCDEILYVATTWPSFVAFFWSPSIGRPLPSDPSMRS